MKKIHFPLSRSPKSSAGNTVFKLSVLLMLLCCGQMAFAASWGGIEITRPDGGKQSWGSGSDGTSENIGGSYSADSNATVGVAKTQTFNGSSCNEYSLVAGQGGCSDSGSDSDSSGCSTGQTSSITVKMNNNTTQACTIRYYGDVDSFDPIERFQTIKVKQYVGWSTPNPGFKMVADPAYTVTAYGKNIQTGTSGLTPSYTSANTAVCTVNSSTGSVANVSAGLCRINVSIPGNGNWTAASGYMEWYVRTTQTISVTTSAPATADIGATFNVAASATSGLSVQITTSGICTVQSGGTATATIKISDDSAGTCNVHFNQPGNNTYAPATQVTEAVTVNKLNQTISFPSQAAQNYSPAGTFAIDPEASATSALAVSYTSLTTGV